MNDDACRCFFLDPPQTLHRRYEVLRAVFVGTESQADIAARFSLTISTVRSLVRDFRAQVQAGAVPPFFERLRSAGPPTTRRCRRPTSLFDPRSLTVARHRSSPVGICEHAWLASSFSCLCWLGFASTPWCARRIIQARE